MKNVRGVLALSVVLAFVSGSARAQVVSITGLEVPDIPAFKILGTDPSDILRPASFQDLAIQLGQFGNSQGILPGNFALETPQLLYLFFGGRMTLQQYRADYFRRTFWLSRLSLGTASLATGGIDVAAGWRVTLWDEADPRLDTSLDATIYGGLNQIADVLGACRRSLGPMASQAQIDSCANSKVTILASNVDTAIARVQRARWTKGRIDFAYALEWESADSTIRHLVPQKHEVWLTGEVPFSSSSQLVFGITGYIARGALNVLDDASSTMSARLNWGQFNLKGLAELRGTAVRGQAPFGELSVGVDYEAVEGIWAEAQFVAQSQYPNPVTFVPKLNLRFGGTSSINLY